jgi:hypothetical protein
MLHIVAILGAVIWFGLAGLLWYVGPTDFIWLMGSAIWGVVFFTGFFVYLEFSDRNAKAPTHVSAPESSN